MKKLTKKAKIALAAAGAGIVALGVTLGVWQPWRAEPVQDTEPPKETEERSTERPEGTEETLTLTVGRDKIPCTLYEGDGWSAYVPEGWEVTETGDGGARISPDGLTSMKVSYHGDGSEYEGSFCSIYPTQEEDGPCLTRVFYTGTAEESWEVLCTTPREDWDTYQMVLTAMARTMTIGEEMPFSGMSPLASEPEWQVTDEGVILWLDKDGAPVDDEAIRHVASGGILDYAEMGNFTGKYRIEDFIWSGSYTCLPGAEFVDVFRAEGVWYEVVPGKESQVGLAGGRRLADGWMHDGWPLDVVMFHDGSAIKEVRVVRTNDTAAGNPAYAAGLLQNGSDTAEELTANQLQQCADWFNARENNGLLRFAYTRTDQAGAYLDVLFYDLGVPEDELGAEEYAAAEAAGVWMELDVYKLSQDYILDYLKEKLGLGIKAEQVLEDSQNLPGTYLEEFDAWYQSHGDTAMDIYHFDRGEYDPSSGYVTLYYTNPFLHLRDQENTGESDVPMAATIRPSDNENGGWVMVSNVVIGE